MALDSMIDAFQSDITSDSADEAYSEFKSLVQNCQQESIHILPSEFQKKYAYGSHLTGVKDSLGGLCIKI